MSTAPLLKSQLSPSTPLVNLFAYIRDLFTTTQPSLRFDDQPNQPHWPLIQFYQLQASDLIHCQWDDPSRPLVALRRGESISPPELPTELKDWVNIVQKSGQMPELVPIPKRKTAFGDSAERIQSYKAFFQAVNGKPIEEVQHLKIPNTLRKWVRFHKEDGKIILSKVEQETELFEESELRRELYIAYARNFHKFQESAHSQIQTNAAYDALHDLFYALKAQADRQICLSFGLVSGKIGGQIYRNFLFHIPLKLALKQQSLSLEADTLAHVISCEQTFTELLDTHFPGESEEHIRERKLRVLQEVDQFNSQSREFNFQPDYLRGTFYETAIRILEVFPHINDLFFTNEGLNFDLPALNEKELSFSFSPVIHLRNLASGVHVAHDADKIISKINELGGQGKNELIPDFFKKLFSLRKPGNPLRIAYRSENKSISSAAISEETTPQRFLFPLPYNQEQLSIARQLLKEDAVTVQGPPGTGKSHTIANLASHFVAEGKSILIVSKNAKALEVIKGKLPPEIRNLAVALLEGTQNQEELKHAIDAVKNHLNKSFDPSEIKRLEAEMIRLEELSDEIRRKIATQIQANQQILTLYDPDSGQEVSANAASWAKKWSNIDPEALIIPDNIHYNQETESWIADITAWLELYKVADPELASLILPSSEQLPDIQKAKSLLDEIEQITGEVDLNLYQGIDPALLDDQFLEKLETYHALFAALKPYQTILNHPRFDLDEIKTIWGENKPISQQIEENSRELLSLRISLEKLQNEDVDFLLEELDSLMGKYNSQGKLSLIKKKLLPQTQKLLLECKINHRSISSLDDLALLQKKLKNDSRIKQLGIIMDNYLSRFGIPGNGEDIMQIYHEWDHLIQRLENQGKLSQEINSRNLDADKIQQGGSDYTDGLKQFRRYKQLFQLWHDMSEPLIEYANVHPLMNELKFAWDQMDISGIEDAFGKLPALREAIEKSKQLIALTEQYENILPGFIDKVKKGEIGAINKSELGTAIFGRKLASFLQEALQNLGDPNELLKELQAIRKQMESLTCQLVAEKTWQHKQATVTDQQRSSLTAWRNDLINIGKGYGKNTARNMASAVSNMQLAREVVPIWIMQQQTAISFFPDPEPGQFDLLIVDEASQCDISMLNLIFRCKKCIIVGDENQTSVATQARLFPIGRTNQLLDRYLVHHPFRQQFNINNRSTSIYTLSGVIYPNIISLREHFRCRPELIGFSNQYVYDGHMIPLKTVENNLYGSPTEVHYIEDSPEDARKPAIIKAIVELVKGMIEDVQAGHLPKVPTLGILCLESSNEAHREMLIRELNRNPLIKEYADELNLLVGTSREFQGDERDIMILTSTASHKFTEAGKIRAPRAVLGEEMMRIYNVAASRARDKAILLHSIHPEAVARMNPDCYRKRLIDYFSMTANGYEPIRVDHNSNHMDPAKGSFGKEIFEWLQEGFTDATLIPQNKIGPYLIDLAIIRGGKKLAIFLDGASSASIDNEQLDRDINQQLVLERAGWQCARIQSLQWTINRQEVEEKLSRYTE